MNCYFYHCLLRNLTDCDVSRSSPGAAIAKMSNYMELDIYNSFTACSVVVRLFHSLSSFGKKVGRKTI